MVENLDSRLAGAERVLHGLLADVEVVSGPHLLHKVREEDLRHFEETLCALVEASTKLRLPDRQGG